MFDIASIIKGLGYVGVFALIFAESGILIGFFLPGDSLLFTAGILASQGFLNIWILAPVAGIAAILGDSVGYAMGKNLGRKVFSKDNSLLFDKSYIHKAEYFYDKYGAKTIVLARFMPVLRTIAPIMAGVGRMKYHVFATYNVGSALIWGVGMTMLGYFLGTRVPNIDHYILPILAIIIFVSILPTIIHLIGSAESRAKLVAFFKKKK